MEREQNEKHRKIRNLQKRVKEKIADIYCDGFVNSVPYTKTVVEIGNGWNTRTLIKQDHLDIWFEQAEPGAYLPEHTHPEKSEMCFVVSGVASCIISGVSKVIHEGKHCKIESGVRHRIKNIGNGTLEIVVCYKPPISMDIDEEFIQQT